MFEPEPGLIIWTVISFGILFLFLAKVAFRPIVEIIEKREKVISESIEEAQKTRVEANRLLEEYKIQVKKAREESKDIISQGRELGENLKNEMVDKARVEAGRLVEQARAQVEREKRLAVKELRNEVAEISVKIAGKILDEELQAEQHQDIIKRYLDEVANL